MDWASTQWKEGLPSVAIQKINALEEKVEKLQKERQQKQLQFECLELAFDKEKRKVEQEKQQTVRLERDLQSLADTCKNLENKQQKLQTEIQNRDSRLNNLEGQLTQAKKQNCRLQQLEKDIEDLRCLRENTKLANKELEEKLQKEQSTIVKQNDAISDLEQTIKSLQGKFSSNEKSFVSVENADKENVNVLNSSTNDLSESLRMKVLEQESVIKDLKEQLMNISTTNEKTVPFSSEAPLSPTKRRNTTSGTPAKSSYSFWDNFGSASANKGIMSKHVNDTSTFDESDEQLRTLQLKLKQTVKELECQRHNSEAAKNAMEQRLKEKENALKAEVKLQAQTIFDMDKELKELRNKYQQDVVQANKKLDVVNGQLQKSELSKQQMEKDLKTLELQITSKNCTLQQKEEELKDLCKKKNNLEVTTKKLQSEKSELDRNFAALQSQKITFEEQLKDLKLQLDGSNNLVKEKELKIQEINKSLSVTQSDKNLLEKKLQTLEVDLSSLKGDVKSVTEEKRNIANCLDLEKSRSQKLECDFEKCKTEIQNLQSEIKVKEENVNSLKSELEQLSKNYNTKILEINERVAVLTSEKASLGDNLKGREAELESLQNNLIQLEGDKKSLADILTAEKEKIKAFEVEMAEMKTKNENLHKDLGVKEKTINGMNTSIEELKSKILEINERVAVLTSEKASLEDNLKDKVAERNSLQNNLRELEGDKKALADILTVEKEKSKTFELEIAEMKMKNKNLHEDLGVKERTVDDMNTNIEDLKSKILEINENVTVLRTEKASLECNLKDREAKQESLQSTLLELEAEKKALADELTGEKLKLNTLEEKIAEMTIKNKDLHNQLIVKEDINHDLNCDIEDLKLKLLEISKTVTVLTNEKASLGEILKDSEAKQVSLQSALLELEAGKKALGDTLTIEKEKSKTLEVEMAEMKMKNENLLKDLGIKEKTIDDMNINNEDLKLKIVEINERVVALTSENASVEEILKDSEAKQVSSQCILLELEAEKKAFADELTTEKEKSKTLEVEMAEMKNENNNLHKDLGIKEKTIGEMNTNIEDLKLKIVEVNERVAVLTSEKASLEDNLKDREAERNSLQNNLRELEGDKKALADILTAEKEKTKAFEVEMAGIKRINDNLHKDLGIKEKAIDEMNANIEDLKLKIVEANERVAALTTEKASLEELLKDFEAKHLSTLRELEVEKKASADQLRFEKENSIWLQVEMQEMKETNKYLHADLDVAEKINKDLNKDNKDLKSKIMEINERVAVLTSEKASLEESLKDREAKEESLQSSLLQLEEDKKALADILTVENEKSERFEIERTEMKRKNENLHKDLAVKEKSINDMNTNIEDLKSKILEVNERVAVLTAEEASLQNTLLELQADKEALTNVLTGEREKSKTVEVEVAQMKMEIEKFNKNVECLEAKILDLNGTVTALTTEKASLEENLKNREAKQESLQSSVVQLEADKKALADMLTTEKERSDTLEVEMAEMKIKHENLDSELSVKEKIISNLNADVEDLKSKILEINGTVAVLASEKASLEENLKNTEESLQNSVLQLEALKAGVLTGEKDKLDALELEMAEIKMERDNLYEDLGAKEKTISDLNNNMEILKIELDKINETIETVKSEKAAFETKLKDYGMKEESLRDSLQKVEAEKQNLAELLISEKQKNGELVIELTEQKQNLQNFESEIQSSKEEKASLHSFIEDLKSDMESMQKSIIHVSNENDLVKSEIQHLKQELLECEEKKVIEKQLAKDLLLSLLDQLNSIEKHAEIMKENFEDKTVKLQQCNELASSEIHKLQQQIQELKVVEENLKKELEEMTLKAQIVPALICNEEELRKCTHELLKELNQKNEMMSSLDSQIINLKKIHEEEKSRINSYIKDLIFCIKSMQSCIKNASTENELIENEIQHLKKELLECEEKKIIEQQLTKDLFLSLLDQLNSIEKHAAVMRENYEDKMTELQQCNELASSEISKLQQQIEEFKGLAENLKKELEETTLKAQIVPALICNEEELRKCTHELLKELNQKSETLSSLDSQIVNLKEIHEVEIYGLKKTLDETESRITFQQNEYSKLTDERLTLLKQVKLLEETLHDKDSELKNAALMKEEHFKCVENIEELTNKMDLFVHENDLLQEENTTLKETLSNIQNKTTVLDEEYNNLLKENTRLLGEIKLLEERLSEKDTELNNTAAVKDEHLKCQSIIADLTHTMDCLSKENDEFQVEISDLMKTLDETESRITFQRNEYSKLTDEKLTLLKQVKLLEENLHHKDSELKNAALIKEEHFKCVENIEELTNKMDLFVHENGVLQEENTTLKETLSNIQNRTTALDEEYDNFLKENTRLLGEIKLLEERLSEKDTELKNTAAVKDEHLKCQSIIADLTHTIDCLSKEKDEFQSKVFLMSQDLKNAKDTMTAIDCEVKNIFMNSKNVFNSTQELEGQIAEVSRHLTDFKNDYSVFENSMQSEKNETEDIYQIVFHSIKLLKKYLSECEILEIPSEVIEVRTDDSFQEISHDTVDSLATCDGRTCQISSHKQMFTSDLCKELKDLPNEVYNKISSFQERNLNQKERFKFLAYHQVFDAADFRNMCLVLKFMKKMYNKMQHKKLALESLKDMENQILSQHKSCEEELAVIKPLFDTPTENEKVDLFFEKCLLISSYKNMYVISKLQRALSSMKVQINADIAKFENYTVVFNKYENVNCHDFHVPITVGSKHLIFLHRISSRLYYAKDKFSCEFPYQKKSHKIILCIKEVLENASISEIPLMLNSLCNLHESSVLPFESCHSLYEHFICQLIKIMISYKKNASFVSCATLNSFEKLMSVISSVDLGSSFHQRHFEVLGDLGLSLLQDLSSTLKSLSRNELDLKRNKSLLNELSSELHKLKQEYESKETEIEELHASLRNENEKQETLTVHIGRIESELSNTVTQKENWKKKVHVISKLCSALKNILSDNCNIVKLTSEDEVLSDDLCLCQDCLNQEVGLTDKEVNHVCFTPVTLIHFVTDILTSKSNCEKEVLRLNESLLNLKGEVTSLENEKSAQQKTIDNLEESFNATEHELGTIKSKFACLENEYESLRSQLLQSNNLREEQQNSFEKNVVELHKCKSEYQEAFCENQRIKDELAKKKEELIQYEKAISEKVSMCESLNTKCKEYESKIESLDATIRNLTDNANEASKKVTALQKSNNLLSITVENVEEELQTIYSEKKEVDGMLQEKIAEIENLNQEVDGMLQEKIAEIENLNQEVTLWKHKVRGEISEASSLEQTMKDLRETIEKAEKECVELKNKNIKLQNEVTFLKKLKKDCEISLHERNICIKEKDLVITKLKEKVSQSAEEKKNLEMKFRETTFNTQTELNEKLALVCDLKNELDAAVNEKEDLQKEISHLLILKSANTKALQEAENAKIKCEDFLSENRLLKSKLETLTREKSTFENDAKLLQEKIIIVTEEMKKAVQLQEELKSEKEKFKKELNSLKKEICVKKKENLESSLLVQELQRKVDELKKEISKSALSAQKKSDELLRENNSLKAEIARTHSSGECKCKRNSELPVSISTESKNDHIALVTKFIDLLIGIVERVQCEDDDYVNKSDLLSVLTNLKHDMDMVHFTNGVQKLQTFFTYQLNKQKDLEMKLYDLTKSVCNFMTNISQQCESVDSKFKVDSNITVLLDKSCLGDSLIVSPVEANIPNHFFDNLTEEMHKSLQMLQSHLNSMKSAILKKDMEIKTSEGDKIQKSKYKLLVSNSERRYKALQQTCEKMEDRIKTLEREKQELEEEAVELSEKLKESNPSNELMETTALLAENTNELRRLREENTCLKFYLKQHEERSSVQSSQVSTSQ